MTKQGVLKLNCNFHENLQNSFLVFSLKLEATCVPDECSCEKKYASYIDENNNFISYL